MLPSPRIVTRLQEATLFFFPQQYSANIFFSFTCLFFLSSHTLLTICSHLFVPIKMDASPLGFLFRCDSKGNHTEAPLRIYKDEDLLIGRQSNWYVSTAPSVIIKLRWLNGHFSVTIKSWMVMSQAPISASTPSSMMRMRRMTFLH